MSIAAGVLSLRPPQGHYFNHSAPPPSATFLLQKNSYRLLQSCDWNCFAPGERVFKTEQLFATFRGKVKFN